MHDPGTQSPADLDFREKLEDYFATSMGSFTERLENFAKYVPRQSLGRFLARYEIFKRIVEVQGSIVECGVLFGGGLMSFAQISAILEPYNFQRRIIGFDTFTGFPGVAEEDESGMSDRRSRHLRPGGFAAPGAYDDLLRAVDVFDGNRFLNHFPKVDVIAGDFAETGPAYLEAHPHLVVSCLYLDFDIFSPTQTSIETFLPRIPKGGAIVFDELNDETFPGETVAVLQSLELSDLRVRRFAFEPRISYAIMGE